jgi:putative membrane protein
MKMKKALCCLTLTLSGVATLLPIHAIAQSDDDKKFLAKVSQADVDEVKLSELAQQKATNPAVKAYANKMVKEHKIMAANFRPFAESWGVTPPADLDEDGQKAWNKLNGLSGSDFDKEYIDQMLSDHAKVYDEYKDEAKDTQDKKFQAAVLKNKTMVAAHKNMAWDLKKKL